jgi:hypothetical protein
MFYSVFEIMGDEEFVPDYTNLTRMATAWEAEFARNQQLHGAKIQCRRGCTDCCHHLFQIRRSKPHSSLTR